MYDAATGAAVNASLIVGSAQDNFTGIAVSGSNLFVANQLQGTIGEYDANTGATINAALVTGLAWPDGIAIADVPEPGSLSVVALGAGVLLVRRRRSGPST